MKKVNNPIVPDVFINWARTSGWTASAVSLGTDDTVSWSFTTKIAVGRESSDLSSYVSSTTENLVDAVKDYAADFNADVFIRTFVSQKWGSVDAAPLSLQQLSSAVSAANDAFGDLIDALECPQLETDLAEWLSETHYYDAIPGEPGCYSSELFADYRDMLPHSELKTILESNCPREAFYDALSDMYADAREYEEYNLEKAAIRAMSEKYSRPELSEIQTTALREFLQGHFYFSEPADHFLKQEETVLLVLDTGDATTDFSLNIHAPHYDGDDSPMDERASLVWLAGQQGYAKDVFESALNEGDMRDPQNFLESCRVELANAGSHMLATVFLVRMTVGQIILLNSLIKLGERCQRERGEALDLGSIVLGKKTTAGLYDLWNGAGGPLEIMLERDVVLPIKYIWGAKPDGMFDCAYSVKQTYGLCDSAFTDTLQSINFPEALRSLVEELAP